MEEDDMFSDDRDFRVTHRVLARRVGVKADELLDMLETLDICSLGLIKMRGGLYFTEKQAEIIVHNFDFVRRMHVDYIAEMAQKRLLNRGLAGFTFSEEGISQYVADMVDLANDLKKISRKYRAIPTGGSVSFYREPPSLRKDFREIVKEAMFKDNKLVRKNRDSLPRDLYLA